jgi:putative flippase GtrA
MIEIIIKLIKYAVVGFLGMIIDFGTTWTLKENRQVNKYVANSVGFVLAATSNFVLNKIWTFKNSSYWVLHQGILFFLFSLIGLGLNNLVIYLLTAKLRWNFYVSKFVAIVFVTFWNFGMNYVFTFSGAG